MRTSFLKRFLFIASIALLPACGEVSQVSRSEEPAQHGFAPRLQANRGLANKVTNAIHGSTSRLIYSKPLPSCAKPGGNPAPGHKQAPCTGNARITHLTNGNVAVLARSGAVLWTTGAER